MSEDEQPTESKFNMSMISLLRMHDLLKDANQFQIENRLPEAYDTLKALWREVYPYMSEIERNEAMKRIDKCVEQLNIIWRRPSAFVANSRTNDKLRSAVELLHLHLITCMKQHGLLIIDKEDIGLKL